METKNKHAFIAADTMVYKIFEADENGNVTWEFDLHGNNVFELWDVGNEKILYCYYPDEGTESGVKIIDKKGNVYLDYKTENEIFSCQQLENGNVLLAEDGNKRLVEIDAEGNIIKVVPFNFELENEHDLMRSARKISEDEYMIVSPGLKKILFVDGNGKTICEYNTRHDTFGAVIRQNGNIVYSCMEGIIELDKKSGKEVWSVLDKDVPKAGICWILGISLRENGNIVCTNWLGHGRAGDGVPLFEVTPEKEIVWSFGYTEKYPNISNICLIN